MFAVSEDIPSLLGVDPGSIWEEGFSDLLPQDLRPVYQELLENPSKAFSNPVKTKLNGEQYNVVRHIFRGKGFLEIEPNSSGTENAADVLNTMATLVDSINEVQRVKILYDYMAEHVKRVLEYDRVMVYKFDEDYHGHVVAESATRGFGSYLDLHFPATDIPKIARDLFLKNGARIIGNISTKPKSVLFNPTLKSGRKILDQTYTQLRVSSPIHIEYLENMGVVSTLTIAIVVDGSLWGLVACHHYSAKWVDYELRRTVEVATNLFAKRIGELEKLHSASRVMYNNLKLEELRKEFRSKEVVAKQLVINGIDLRQMCDADGFAVVSREHGVSKHGNCPDVQELDELSRWLFTEKKEVYHTSDLTHAVPLGIGAKQGIGGLLAIRFGMGSEDYLLWFRDMKRLISRWAGDPHNPFEVERNANGEVVRVSPRKSFEEWKIQTEDHSLPWDAQTLDFMGKLREFLLVKEYDLISEKVAKIADDFDQLTMMAAHDLKAPLRVVRSYLKLLTDHKAIKEDQSATKLATMADTASERLEVLMSDMLDYAQRGKKIKWEWVKLDEVVESVLKALESDIENAGATVDVQPLPTVFGSRMDMHILISNLLSNAIKYQSGERTPKVSLTAIDDKDNDQVRLVVTDNGIGIDKEKHGEIFRLFVRLHGTREYPGTGIGLAIVKRIVDTYHVNVLVDSEPGKGSTFSVVIDRSMFRF